MVRQDNIDEANEKLGSAERSYDAAKGSHGREEIRNAANYYPGSFFTHSQRAIEHATKALFLLLEVNVPQEHFIEMDSGDAEDLLNASEAELEPRFTEQIARILFINQLYGSSYPTSEYGIETSQRTIEANSFLNRMEADHAYDHADEVIRGSRHIISYVEVNHLSK